MCGAHLRLNHFSQTKAEVVDGDLPHPQLRLDSVYETLTSLADSHEEATAKSVSLVLLGREWHMSLLETTEPVEPPLASITKIGIHYVPGLK